MAIKQPALIAARDNRKKKKENENLKVPTAKATVSKPTVKSNDKGKTYVDRSTISKKPTTQNTAQKRIVTNKDRLTSKSNFGGINNDIRTVKTTKKSKPKQNYSVGTYDIYKRDGRYYYNDGKEKEIDKNFVEKAIKEKKTGVIGNYNSKGQLRRTDSRGNVKEQNLLNKASYLARTAKTRAKKGTIAIADAVLQETQNDLKKGENLKTVGDKVAKFASAIFNSNPEQGIKTAVSKAIANSGRIWKDEDKNILQKYVGSVLEGSQAIGTGQMQGLKDIRELAGSYDKNLDEKVAKVQKKLDEPVNKELEQLELEKYNYGKGMRRAADIVGTTANMAPGIATSIITRNPELGILPMALSAKGQTTERALQQGADLDTAIKMGTTSGLIEGGTEQLSGLGLGIFGKGTIDDIISNAINSKIRNKGINFIAKQGFGLAGEINEELISDLAGLMIDKGTIDPNAKYTFEDFLETVKNTFGSTILMNLLTGGYGSGAYNSNINDMNNFNIQQQQANEINQRVESGEIDDIEGLALLDQVKDGTYQKNRNLEQIATQESQRLKQAAQQGIISQEEYTQGLQALTNTVNQTREEINTQQKVVENNKEETKETTKDNYEELKKKAEKEVVKTTSQKSGKEGRMYQGKFYSDDNFNLLDDDDIKLTAKLMKKQENQQKLTKNEEQQVGYLRRKREGLKNPEINPDIKGYDDIKSDYKYVHNHTLTKTDSKKIQTALDIVSANRQGRRTKQQWLDIANNIGMQSENLDSEALKNLAYGSWAELSPNQKDVLNRQGSKYVSFDAHEWVREVYKGAKVGTKISENNVEETKEKQSTKENVQQETNQNENIPATKSENVISEEVKPQTQETTNETVNQNTETQQETAETPQQESKSPEILDKMPTENKSIFKKLKEQYNAFRHHFTDHREAWYDLSRETRNPDINNRADAIDLANGKAQVDIGRAQIDYNGKRYKNFTDENGNKVSMSFEGAYDLYKEIPVKAKNEYLVHQLNVDRLNQGVDQFGIPLQESLQKIQELENEYKNMGKWSENIYQYYRNLAQKLVDAGRLSQEKVDEWQKTTPHYVHIQKDVGKKGNTGVSTKSGKVDSSNLIQKVKGGSYPILPIKQVTADYTRNAMEAIQINNLGKEYLKTVGVGSRADGTQQINDIDDIFVINQDLIKDDGKGNYTFVVYDKGNVIEVPISKDMYEGLKPRDIRKVAVTSDIVKLQREIITNKNPIFGLIRNPAKDVQAMALYSKHGAAKTGSTYAKLFTGRTVGKMFQKNNPNKVSTQDIIDLYYDVGNQANSYYNNGEFESEKRQPRTKAGKALGKVSSALEKGNNFFESMPRITEFWNTIQSEGYTINKSGEGPVLVPMKGKNPTKSVEQVLMEASHDAAEITVNFKRGGTWGKNLDRNFAVYSSPAIQGAAKFGRTVTEAVGDAKSGDYKALTRLVSRAAALGIAPALLSEAMYGDDDDYKDIQEYQKDQYYLIKRPDGKWLRIPKGREISTIQSLTRRGMNKASGEKDAFKGYGSFAINQVGPTNPLESNFASPLISAFLTNRSWSGNPIVSDYMKNNFADEDQYNEKTDELSKWIGKKTGISPMKINYILDQYSGGVGDVALPYITPKANSNTNNPVSSILKNEFSFDQANSSKSVSKFYDAKNEINKAFKKRDASDEDKVKKVYMGTISQSLFDLSTKKREIQMDKNLSKKEKYEQALDIQKEMNKLTSDAVKNLDKVDVGENTATIGGILLYKNKNSKNGWSQESEKATKNREKLGLSPEKYYYYKNEESYTPPGGEKSTSITSGKNAKYNIAIVDAFNFDPSDYLEYKYKLSKIRGNKDSRGRTIRYSARNKKLKYLNTLPISAVEKAYLMKQNDKYYKGSDYNLKKAISNSSLSNKEKKELYSYLKLGR